MRALISVSAALLVASCTGEREAGDTQPAPSAGAGAAVVPSPSPAQPTDAGRERAEPASDVRAVVFNRVLGKLKEPDAFDAERLKAAIEERTGAEVKEIRKGAMGLVSVIFEPTDPPRDAEAQHALVEAVAGVEELAYAEPERLMQAR